MKQYLDLCKNILINGERQSNRTGIDTVGVFGAMMQFDLREGFPILTTKKVLFDTVVDELLWFIRGGSNINDSDAPKKIWDAWADQDGNLGRIYGVQWRDWTGWRVIQPENEHLVLQRHGIDQMCNAIDLIKKSPNSRQNIVSAWNVDDIDQGLVGFKPCHVMFQFKVNENHKRLDLAMYQRSCDMALGVPFNISSYALLLSLIANECNLTPGIFTHFLADAHIYVNHISTMEKQLKRLPRRLPCLSIKSSGKPVIAIRKDDIELIGYNPYSFLKYDVAV